MYFVSFYFRIHPKDGLFISTISVKRGFITFYQDLDLIINLIIVLHRDLRIR